MDWVQIAGLAGAASAALIALLEYRSNTRWRRADSLAQLMKAWREHPANRISMQLLDVLVSDERIRVDFGGASAKWGVAPYQEVDAALVLRALWTPKDRPATTELSPEQLAVCQLIRENLEYFLADLSHMERYMRMGLYRSSDMRQYLKWYVGILSGSLAGAEAARSRIHGFLQAYTFDDVLAIVDRSKREKWSKA